MIRLESVTKVYDGGVVALKDISVDINKGEFVFLVGPSGSGKSTMIRLMMAEEGPTNGDIWVAGKHASDLPNWKVPHLRRSIGTVFQDFKLLPSKTVYENVAFAMEVTGKQRSVVRTQVPQVLKLVGLSAKADRYPKQLSGGEQQRVSVARAFVNRPLILLADEPTGNLDPATSVGIMRILDRINRTGTTVVMATHDHAIVDAMQRRVVQLDRGRLVRDERRGAYETILAREPVPLSELEADETITSAEPPAAEVQVAEPGETTGEVPAASADHAEQAPVTSGDDEDRVGDDEESAAPEEAAEVAAAEVANAEVAAAEVADTVEDDPEEAA